MAEQAQARALHLQALGRLLLLLAVPALIGALMWLGAVQAQRRALLVQHTLLIELSLERLLSDVNTAAAAQREFLLTGQPEFRDASQSAQGDARSELDQLAQLTSHNPVHQTQVAHLRPALDALFAQIAQAMAKTPEAHPNLSTVQAVIETEIGPTNTIHTLINHLFQDEERLLLLRKAALRTAAERFYWWLFCGYGLIILIVASLYRSVKRYSTRSAEAEARLSALNADLEQRVLHRTALLQAREELLTNFVQNVPAAVAMFDREMCYLQVSNRWCSDLQMERENFIGRCHYEIFPDLPARWKIIHQRSLKGETLRADEDTWEHKGKLMWLRWEVRPWGTCDGLPEGVLIFNEDITARKQIEETLRDSEVTNRTLLDTASQAILTLDASGTIVQANKMVGQIFGYSSDELIGKPHDILISPALRERHHGHLAAFVADPRPRMMGKGRDLVGVRKDGVEFPIEVSLNGLETKHGMLAVSFVTDITARKEAEMELRRSEQNLRALAAKLLTAQEEERSNLARELHDDITQQLAFLSIELGRLVGELRDSPHEVRDRLKTLQKQIGRASSEVRRISHGLHPSVIADFGLTVALEEFCEEFEKAYRIRVVFEGSAADTHLDDVAATCLYRIAQESMRNAVQHGRAGEVNITLQPVNHKMELRVQDNGIGFSEDSAHSRTGLGIVSMAERVRLVNGTLQISSEAGGGATVTASVPLKGGDHGDEKNTPG